MHRRNTRLGARRWSRKLRIEPLEDRRVLSSGPIVSLSLDVDEAVTASSLPEPPETPEPPQASPIPDAEVPTLPYWRFPELMANQVSLLTLTQIASIPDTYAFNLWPTANREALSNQQVQHLNTATITLTLLTAAQRLQLTDAQIQLLPFQEFRHLAPAQVPKLLPTQIATIPDTFAFNQWPSANRAALVEPQVQALRVASITLNLLTAQQKLWLTAGQIQTLAYQEFRLLDVSQIPSLSVQQIATIPDTFAFNQWSAAQRGALTQTQVPGLQIPAISISLLTTQQRLWLSDPQIQSLVFADFLLLVASQIPKLTPAQIATIPDTFAFQQWPQANREALTLPQVQALRVPPITIGLLPPPQRLMLSVAQIQALPYQEYGLLDPSQVVHLTTTQIGGIPDTYALEQWPAANRGAMTLSQVQALRVPPITIGLLPSAQRLMLSVAQIQALPFQEFPLLEVSQVGALTLVQIASIPDNYAFGLWPLANRLALSQAQLQALSIPPISISLLTEAQRLLLSLTQIQSLPLGDIPLLAAEQIPLLAPAQFAQMQNLFYINGFSDAVKNTLTRAQLMALPFNVLSNYMFVETEQYPPANYRPATHTHGLPVEPPFPGTLSADAYRITKAQDATHRAIADGDWNTPAIWSTGTVPGSGAKVYIPVGRTVRFNAQMTSAIFTLRIDGTLRFATDVNTTMRVDTIVVGSTGVLHIGAPTAPIADHVVAQVIFPDGGPINTTWDPALASRGLISRGETRVFGRTVTPYVALAVDPLMGHTTLQLAETPVGWRVGDELVIAGTTTINSDFGSERVTITAINGATVSLNRGLTYNHDAPDGMGFSVHVANMNRNVQFIAEEQTNAQERPHIAFTDNPNAWVENASVKGFGRTDKAQLVTDPVVVNDVLQSGGANPRARYALHFHHTGVHPAAAPGVLRGNVVDGGPGWGYVNHQSHVVMENNVAVGVVGAAFVTEDGNEIGVMRNNLAMNATGSGVGGPLTRRAIHDFGHNGHGFWLQGPGVEIENNLVAGTRSGAYSYFTSSNRSMFDAVNLADPSIAMGHAAVPLGVVPIRLFKGNTSYGVNKGLELWFNQTMLTDGESVIEDFTTWNTRFGVELFYVGRVTFKNMRLFGRPDLLHDGPTASPTGVFSNRIVHDITFDNPRIEWFVDGMFAPMRRATTIIGGRFGNVRNLTIAKGQDTIRSVHVAAPIEFVPVTAAQIAGRTTYDVSVTQKLTNADHLERKVESLFSADDIRIALANGTTLTMYFADQQAGAIPFPTPSHPEIAGFPAEYAGKTNLQLWQQYGVWFNGGDAPAGAVTLPRFVGLAVAESTTQHRGDFNGDGDVDGGDFLAWQRGLGSTSATRPDGDADGDGDVDGADRDVWATTYATPDPATSAAAASSTAASAPVSEPSFTLSPELADLAMAQAAADAAPVRRARFRRVIRSMLP